MKRTIKILSLIIVTFSSFSLAHAQCVEGNCRTGNGVKLLGNGFKYEGQFLNGRFHGKGEIIKRSTTVYKGHFAKGKKHGTGIMYDKVGNKLRGTFANGSMQGIGTIYFANGDRYEGRIVNNVPHGDGKMTYLDQSTYQGQWQSGQRNGNGIIVYQDGRHASGLWTNDSLIIQLEDTKQVASTTSRYKDCTDKSCHNETGTFHYTDGSMYIGQFVHGEPEGKGRCEYINGDLYEGGWSNHAPHGIGTMHFANGQSVKASWSYGHVKERLYEEKSITDFKIKNQKSNTDLGRSEIYAVVVGVAAYPHLPSLKYTDDDAYKVYAFLKSPEGGALPDSNIRVLIDESATKLNIAQTMQEIYSKADENDIIILYLAGHGLKGSYLPYDFDGSNNVLTYQDLLEVFESSRAKNKLCITDACHSGSLLASRSGYAAELDNFYRQLETTESGLALLASSSTEEVSLEYSGLRQGVFSHYLIRGLKGEANQDANDVITIAELYSYISQQVGKYTNFAQTPSLGGDFDPDMPVSVVLHN